ncbi:MAG: hypothetical protein LBQ47_02690 [Endomicrobium sp.]|jgi:hypothetical protein|nr:hypothetical protein [Endomicrobium sp.]
MKKIKAVLIAILIILNASTFNGAAFAVLADKVNFSSTSAEHVINFNSFIQITVQPAYALIKITNVLKQKTFIMAPAKNNDIQKHAGNKALGVFSQDKLFGGSKKFVKSFEKYYFAPFSKGEVFEKHLFTMLFILMFLLFIIILRKSSLPALSISKQIQRTRRLII